MTPFEKLISDLNVLSTIPRGTKLDTRGEFINIDYSVLPSVMRTFSGNDKEKTYYKIHGRVRDCLYHISLIMESAHFHGDVVINSEYITSTMGERYNQLRKICEALRGAQRGIENLKFTYNYDESMLTKLSNINADILNYIENITNFLDIINVIKK